MSEPQQDELLDGDESAEGETAGLDQPAGSRVTVERFPEGLTLQVPPAGLWHGTRGLFFVVLLVDGVLGLVSAVLLVSLLGDANRNNSIWILPVLLSVFWAVGIGLLLGAINMGRRRAAIAVTGGTLMVIQTGIFGSKQRDWPPGEVEAVCAGPSGMTVNDVPVLELQIFDGSAHKFGLLAGRSNDELHWMAAELRRVLNVPGQPR